MTAPYRICFAADKPDLIDSIPAAHKTYLRLKEEGGVEYELVREAIKRLIAAAPYLEDSSDPHLAGGPGSRWARRHLYRSDGSQVPRDTAVFTIWINTPARRWWLTWSRDRNQASRLIVYSLTPAPGD